MAEIFDEPVYFVENYSADDERSVRWTSDGILEVQHEKGKWVPIRAAFRYVTQKPWSRFPISETKTLIINPIIACLAGGRNKLVAAKAYDFFNASYEKFGIQVHAPETIADVRKLEIPLRVKSFGGHAVVKVPYSNAGQGVFTITSKEELDSFMKSTEFDRYDQYIVQSLVGNSSWSSTTRAGSFFHVGTVPTKKNEIFAADIRMMIHYDFLAGGLRPLAIYSRRAHIALPKVLESGADSWDILGTNLSVKAPDGSWTTDTSRLLLMDGRDFNKLGLGVDDLIMGYLQTVFSVVAIDQLACRLMREGKFNFDLFDSLNKDPGLVAEFYEKKSA